MMIRTSRKFLFAFLAVASFLCICEVVLFFTPIHAWSRFEKKNRSPLMQEDYDLLWRLKPNLDVSVKGITNVFFHVRTNDAGLRCPERCTSWEQLLASDVPNILCLGGSVTFGWGVNDEDAFPVQLQTRLREASGRPIRCINGGVPGFTSTQSLKWFRMELAALHPRVLVVCFSINDASRTLSKPDHLRMQQTNRFLFRSRQFVEKFHLFRAMEWLFFKMRRKNIDAISLKGFRVPPELFRKNLESFCRFGKAHDVDVILMNEFTTRGELEFQKFYQAMRSVADTFHVPFIDASERFRKYKREVISETGRQFITSKIKQKRGGGKRKKLRMKIHSMEPLEAYRHLFVDDYHPNRNGNALISEWVFHEIIRKGITF